MPKVASVSVRPVVSSMAHKVRENSGERWLRLFFSIFPMVGVEKMAER